MHSLTFRPRRFAALFVTLAILGGWLSHAAAQTDVMPGIDGNSYVSPAYEYSLYWDEAIWAATSAGSANGIDSMVLTSSGTNLYVDGLYFYQGDAVGCLNAELERVAAEQGVAQVIPLTDVNGEPRLASGDGWAQIIFGIPDAAQPDRFTMVVYLECRTVVPNSVVMILAAYMDPADAAAQEVAVLDVIATVQMGDIGPVQMDMVDLEAHIGEVMTDLDGFWITVFADLGATYPLPNYDYFSAPLEIQCGDFLEEQTGPFYCWDGEIVYFEPDLIRTVYLPFGLSMVDWMVAHEVGHHVQIQLGLSGCGATGCGPNTDSKAIELQADCLGAAWMQDAAARGFYDERDIERIEAGAKAFLGDPSGTSVDDPQAHGTGDERFEAFLTGYEGGIAACGVE